MHRRVRLEVEGIQEASVLFTPGCTAVLHTSHTFAARYYAADISLLIWNLGHRHGPGKLAGKLGSMQIVISN